MSYDPLRRTERYRLKADPERVFELLKALKGDMQRRQEYEQVQLIATEIKARAVLNECGVPTIMYVHYLNFAREMHSRQKRFAGASLAREARVLINKWVDRTLERDALEKIRYAVYSVADAGLPGGEPEPPASEPDSDGTDDDGGLPAVPTTPDAA